MRTADLWRLALKSLRPGFVLTYVCLLALAVCGVYFSCAAMHTVLTEKAEPCELTVTSGTHRAISDETARELAALPGVLAATNRIELPVTLTAGKYEAALTLVGVDARYLDVQYDMGGVFPENSVMPWLVLSKESRKAFHDPSDTTRRDASYIPPVDWLEADYALRVGDNTLTAKVSGIFEGEAAADAGYLNLDIAKSILQEQGQSGAYTSAVVRIQNIGAAQEVTNAIKALGYAVSDPNTEQQARWDALQTEALYLFLLGLAVFAIASQQRRLEQLRKANKRAPQHAALRWMGMSERQMKNMRALQAGFLCISGASLGLGISYVIPRFLSIAQKADSVFLLTLPLPAAAMCWLCCAACTFCLSREGAIPGRERQTTVQPYL